jgi:tetratricopeptide (TPR) repeat protein
VYFSRALEIDKAVEGEIHPKVALRLQRIGETYVRMQQYQSALDFYERAAAINLKIYNEDHPRHAEDLFNLGIVCYRLDLLERSLQHLRKTLDIYTRVLEHERNDKLVIGVEHAIARVEEALARKQMSPEEYEEWKRRIAEERLRRSLGQNYSGSWQLQADGKEERAPDPIVIKTPNVYSSGEIGKAQSDVLDDEFFEL